MSCCRAQSVPAHIAEDRHAVFRGLPAHRRTGAPRARYAALRSHEADGAERSAHREAALGRGAASPGESARPELQPGGLSESLEVRRAGAHPAHDSRAGARGVPALRADPSQHLYQRAGAAHPHAATARAAPGECSSPGRSRAWKATWRPSPPGCWRACTPPPWRPGGDAAARFRARPPWARCATTFRAPIRPTTSRPTSPSTCCRSSTRPRGTGCGTTRRRGMPRSAGARWRPWKQYRHAHV